MVTYHSRSKRSHRIQLGWAWPALVVGVPILFSGAWAFFLVGLIPAIQIWSAEDRIETSATIVNADVIEQVWGSIISDKFVVLDFEKIDYEDVMKQGGMRIVVGVITLIIGLVVGAWLGAYLGFGVGASDVAAISINTQIHDIENRVQALRSLRQGDTDSALEFIESGLDRDIVSLEPDRRENIRLREHTLDFISQGLRTAKQYRDEFPRSSQGELIDDSIRKAFSTL